MSDTTENIQKEKNNDDEFSIFNLNSVINFIQNNIIQLLLLGIVFFVIYAVDRVTHFNNILVAMQQQQIMKEQMKQMKKGKKGKKH
jgi:hypothetical protein